MGRTLRSKRDRLLLYLAAQGRCQRCGEVLGDDWQADHIDPWCETKRTNLFEMQALCARCNREKGKRKRE
jgi:5-methylcytosine-specific restriction endonuclease McrA